MTGGPHHRIQRQIMQLSAPDQACAWRIQSQLGRIQKSRLADIIDRCFTDLCPPGQLQRIDALTIELGRIDPDRFEEELAEKLEPALRQALRRWLEDSARLRSLDGSPSDADGPGDAQLELLESFMSTGSLPWWADSRGPGAVAGTVRWLLQHARLRLLDFLRTHVQPPDGVLRLVLACEDEDLVALLDALVSRAAGRVTLDSPLPEESKKSARVGTAATATSPGTVAANLKMLLEAHDSLPGLGARPFRSAVWCGLLETAIAKGGAAAWTVPFWSEALGRIAVRAQVTWRALSKGLARRLGAHADLWPDDDQATGRADVMRTRTPQIEAQDLSLQPHRRFAVDALAAASTLAAAGHTAAAAVVRNAVPRHISSADESADQIDTESADPVDTESADRIDAESGDRVDAGSDQRDVLAALHDIAEGRTTKSLASRALSASAPQRDPYRVGLQRATTPQAGQKPERQAAERAAQLTLERVGRAAASAAYAMQVASQAASRQEASRTLTPAAPALHTHSADDLERVDCALDGCEAGETGKAAAAQGKDAGLAKRAPEHSAADQESMGEDRAVALASRNQERLISISESDARSAPFILQNEIQPQDEQPARASSQHRRRLHAASLPPRRASRSTGSSDASDAGDAGDAATELRQFDVPPPSSDFSETALEALYRDAWVPLQPALLSGQPAPPVLGARDIVVAAQPRPPEASLDFTARHAAARTDLGSLTRTAARATNAPRPDFEAAVSIRTSALQASLSGTETTDNDDQTPPLRGAPSGFNSSAPASLQGASGFHGGAALPLEGSAVEDPRASAGTFMEGAASAQRAALPAIAGEPGRRLNSERRVPFDAKSSVGAHGARNVVMSDAGRARGDLGRDVSLPIESDEAMLASDAPETARDASAGAASLATIAAQTLAPDFGRLETFAVQAHTDQESRTARAQRDSAALSAAAPSAEEGAHHPNRTGDIVRSEDVERSAAVAGLPDSPLAALSAGAARSPNRARSKKDDSTRSTQAAGSIATAVSRARPAPDPARLSRSFPQPRAQAAPRVRRDEVRRSEPIYLENAGLILLWPFLQTLCERLQLIEDKRWVDEAARDRACCLMQHAVSGERTCIEYQLALPKVLCGMVPTDLAGWGPPVTDDEAQECSHMLTAVLANIAALSDASIAELRAAYLLRTGILTVTDGRWLLRVERTAQDDVLGRIAWPLSFVKLPWMSTPLAIDW